MGLLPFGKSSNPIGLDIGTNTLRAIQLKQTGGLPTVVKYGYLNIAHGAINEGEITDVDVISKALTSLWKKSSISDRSVIVGVANQKVVVRLIEIPYMTYEELKGAIQYQAQDFIPIPVEEAIIDFQIVGEFTSENDERMIEVLLVAAQKDMIGLFVEATQKANLKLEAIDVTSFAIERSLLKSLPVIPEEEEESSEAIALINIGAGITNIIIVERNVPRFTRVLAYAANDFTKVITENAGLSFDEAEELKINIGLPPLEGDRMEGIADNYKERAEEIQNILQEESYKFVAEIRRSFDYYLAQQAQFKGIDKIIMSGGGAELKNFLPYLEMGLQAEAIKGKPLSNVQVPKSLQNTTINEDESSLAIPIGLALRRFESD